MLSLTIALMTTTALATTCEENAGEMGTEFIQVEKMNDLMLLFLSSVILFGIAILIEFTRSKIQERRG